MEGLIFGILRYVFKKIYLLQEPMHFWLAY